MKSRSPVSRRFMWLAGGAALVSLLSCGGSDGGGTGTGSTGGTSTGGTGISTPLTYPISVSIAPSEPPVAATGETLELTATVTLRDGSQNNTATWVSSDDAVATVSPDGLVSANSAGFATIRASTDCCTASVLVTVTAAGTGLPAGYLYILGGPAPGLQGAGTVSQYAIGTDGGITPVSATSVAVGDTPASIVSDPQGDHVYVANAGDASISQFAVGAGGVLQPLAPASVGVSGASPGLSTWLSIAPGGGFLYAVAPAGSGYVIAQYSIGPDGALSPLTPGFISVGGSASGPLAIDATGQLGFLAGTLSSAPLPQELTYTIKADGTVAVAMDGLPPFWISPSPVSATIGPTNESVYLLSACVNSACDGQIATFGLDGGRARPTPRRWASSWAATSPRWPSSSTALNPRGTCSPISRRTAQPRDL